ncbi:MAG: M67 family metallopeptidase [Dehalococcoidia bacterium]|nr:M67 family metallopeptidase [Dehalococcoidia bacterium]
MAVAIRLRKEHLDAMIAHGLEDTPVECCGVLGGKDGTVHVVRRAKNIQASPYRFEIHPLETGRIEREFDEQGIEILGYYHSHTGTAPVPSPTDVRAMGPLFGPPFVHFVLGLKDVENPEARAWYIQDGAPVAREFEVIDG